MMKKRIIYIIIFLLITFVVIGLNDDIETNYYEIDVENVEENIRFAFISDFHSNDSKDEIITILEETKPDAILLGGDIIDDELDYDAGFDLIRELSESFPVYYVSGNHEYWSNEYSMIRSRIIEMEVTVLEGDCIRYSKNDSVVGICGIDDFENPSVYQQLDKVADTDNDMFKILLAHRPEKIDLYESVNLVLSGHAHGGQWRIPFILENGLLAPNQGLFPEYTSGIYDFADKQMIVSRGLAKESTIVPRFYNKREIIIVDLY